MWEQTHNNTEICHCPNINGLHLYLFLDVSEWWSIMWWMHYLETMGSNAVDIISSVFVSAFFSSSLNKMISDINSRERKDALFFWFDTTFI